MRIEAGRNPHDRGLQDLVGELSTRSEEFATLWAAHNVKIHTTATKTLRHPVVGELELTGEALLLPGDPGLVIITYTVEPNSSSAHALRLPRQLERPTDDPHRADTAAVPRHPTPELTHAARALATAWTSWPSAWVWVGVGSGVGPRGAGVLGQAGSWGRSISCLICLLMRWVACLGATRTAAPISWESRPT